MKRVLFQIILLATLLISGGLIYGQSTSFCPSINAQFGTGPSTTICQGNCANLSASVVPVNQTTSYSVSSIAYSPYSFTAGTSIIANQDDVWSSVLNLGFPFCYFGNNYTQGVVGSNGQLTFSLGLAGGFNQWSISAALPSLTNMPGNTICAAFRDIDPSSSGNIYFATYGTAPCRAFVISWNNIPMFSSSCASTANSTFQLVLHETTNFIDVFINNSTACTAWNSGYGIVGIQNINATIGVPAPGRNFPTAWTATNEGWRFTPTGAPTYTVNWTGPTGPVGTGLAVNVCPTTNSTYTANMSVSACGGPLSTYSSVVSVSVVPGPTLVTNSPTICTGGNATLTVSGATSYTWLPSNSTATSIVVAPAATTIYTVLGSNGGSCTSSRTVQVTVGAAPTPSPASNSPICAGSALNLTVGAATSYTWTGPNSFSSNLQNPTIPSASTLAAGNYTVTLAFAGGCTSTAVVNVVVVPASPVTANNIGPICAGQTLSLTSTGSGPWSWTGPNTFANATQNPTIPLATTAASGVYTVIAGVGTCTTIATTTVLVNPTPTSVPNSNSPICAGQTINLTGAGGTTYTWTGPAFTSNTQNPNITNAQAANSGTYTLTVSGVGGCTNVATTNVVVNPLPTIVVSNPTTCVNTTINLTSTGGVTYSWTGPGGFTSALQNPNIPNSTLAMTGVYVVTVTNANGCINTANSNVLVLNAPNPNIASNSPVCVGGTLNLFGSGGAAYAWSGPGYNGLLQNPVITNVTTAAAGVYTLLVSSGTCTASTTHTVLINPVPVFNFAGSNALCFGQSNGTSTVNVTVGTGPFNYSWSTVPAQTTQDASGLAAGTYSCTVTDANGCSSIASTQITQPTLFTVSINAGATSACAGVPINVNAVGNGGTGPYNYNWVSGPATAVNVINEATPGNFNYVVNAVDAFNCPATANISLTFFAQPTISATSATLCAGQSTAVLVASGATSYVWQPGNVTGSTYAFSGTTSQVISVVGTANGCSNSATTAVMVNPAPTANISTSTANGCVPVCMTFSANGGAGITSYNWILYGAGITGSVNGAYCFDEAASYTLGLTLMDGNGCTGTVVPVNVEIYPQPVADFNHSPLKPIVNQDPFVTFTDASWNATIVSWNWYFMNTAQYTSILQNPTFPYTEPGTYPVVLVVKSDKGCIDTLVRPLVVGEDFGIYVPNTFTPNGDGLNDIFQPKGFGVVKYELNIFDRWGEKVFSTTEFEKGWDGTMQSKKDVKYGIIEDGTYSWLINATSVFGKSHELKGHVVLMK
jgi:gliding motility-associated-like protein